MQSEVDNRPHVVIIGGGFGGLAAAMRLRKSAVRVTLVDRSNHHLFQPLLYQVATAALSAPVIAMPLRKLFPRDGNVAVLMARALSIDLQARQVELDSGRLEYDFLLLATGMVNNYFGNDSWERVAPGLKTLREALDIRARVLRAFEAAERQPDPNVRKELLSFAVIGGGPTGVEMAGALAEIATRTLAEDFANFDSRKDTRVLLIEGGPRVLPAFDEVSSRAACAELEDLGVEVLLGNLVTGVDKHGIDVGETRIPCATVIWAAGLRASPLTANLGVETDWLGRLKVADDLSLPGHKNVFAIGDIIHREQDGELLPGVAQTAIQGGAYVADLIDRRVEDLPLRGPFRYRDKGSMATIGRARAVAEFAGTKVSGFVAWLIWLAVHIFFLVGFRNRLIVMMEWAYAYLTWGRSARVILDAPARVRPGVEAQQILEHALASSDERT